MKVCMVPVRKGSERLAKKNYLQIGRYTVAEITLLKALLSKVFDKIVLNTDDPELEEISLKLGVEFYLREKTLASSNATSDQVVLDFFENNEGDKIFWVNTVSPLQTITDITNFVEIFEADNLSSAVSINSTQVHAVYEDIPLNFEWKSGFARTQDLKAVKSFNYAIMGWERGTIKNLINGQLFDSNTRLVESSRWSSFLLKNDADMKLIRDLANSAPDQGIKF
tara:strand:+ start:768 stop:1439 length:672 start_codon:yes stop_codon:yes gene_type:complete